MCIFKLQSSFPEYVQSNFKKIQQKRGHNNPQLSENAPKMQDTDQTMNPSNNKSDVTSKDEVTFLFGMLKKNQIIGKNGKFVGILRIQRKKQL